MDEYIERGEAIEAVKHAWEKGLEPSQYLEIIPAADVVPVRHGRWVQVIVHVEFEDGFVDRVEEYCSACHEPNEGLCTYFCPNCGADMRGSNDE